MSGLGPRTTTIATLSSFLSAYNLFCKGYFCVILLTCIQPFTTFLYDFTAAIFKHATCLNTRLTELLLIVVCYAMPSYSPARSVKQNVLEMACSCSFPPSREIYWYRLFMCSLRHVFTSCLLLLVVYLKAVRCIHVHTNSCWCCWWFAYNNLAAFICVGVFV